MGFLVRLLWFVLFLFLLRFLWSKLFGGSRLSSSDEPRTITGQAHKDPQCGIYVAEELAVKAPDGSGQQYYFCSVECRDRFLAKS